MSTKQPVRFDNPPWERQPDESDKAWRAFQVYRDLGLGRSLVAVQHQTYGPPRGVRRGVCGRIRQWAKRYCWRERIAAWEQQKERVRQEAALGTIAEIAMQREQDLTPAWVIERLRVISDRCVQAEPVVDKAGHAIGQFKFNASGAIKATQLLGRHLHMFGDDDERESTRVSNFTLFLQLANSGKLEELLDKIPWPEGMTPREE